MKIVGIDELSEIVCNLKLDGKKVVMCHGVFELMHPGHIKHFEAAKKFGDVLIVTITSDACVAKGPGRPVFNQRLRLETLAKNEDIDYVAINDEMAPYNAILAIKPDVYVKGKDYENAEDDITGEILNDRKAVEEVGGEIKFTDEITFSSTNILNRDFGVYSDETNRFLDGFRKKYSSANVIETMQLLSGMKVLIVGESIIDQYVYCSPFNKSPKEYIIPTKYIDEESFAGGALATANHVAGICDIVWLVSCLGTGDFDGFVSRKLKSNIVPKLFHCERPTIVKRRFVEPTFLRKMFEICYIDDTPISNMFSKQICNYLSMYIGDVDLVIVNDFGHGMINASMASMLCENAKFLAVNTQTNSANFGFNLATKYPRADYICIDDPEIRLACNDKHGSIDSLVQNLAERMHCKYVAVTHSKYDTVVYSESDGIIKVPAFSSNVVDTVGAGDAVLSMTAPMAAMQCAGDMIGFVGNATGALKVQSVGNRESIDPIKLYKFIMALLG